MFAKPICLMEYVATLGYCRCTRCGNVVKTKFANQAFATCRQPHGRCDHLGEQLDNQFRLVFCKTCQGNVQTKVQLYACSEFGSCILRQCENCEAHSANHVSLPANHAQQPEQEGRVSKPVAQDASGGPPTGQPDR